ncbi:hypothetical protein OHPBIL_OHPBIL_03380, partial [Dysosmobacter welbionis]
RTCGLLWAGGIPSRGLAGGSVYNALYHTQRAADRIFQAEHALCDRGRTHLSSNCGGRIFLLILQSDFYGDVHRYGGKRGGSALHGHRAGGEHHSGPAYDLWDRPIPADGR